MLNDLTDATFTETLYLRKWPDGAREAGGLPEEILVVTCVSEPDKEPVTNTRTLTDLKEIREANARAEEIERRHYMPRSGRSVAHNLTEVEQITLEVEELTKRVKRYEKDEKENGTPHRKLLIYREQLERAQRRLAEAKKEM